MTWIKENLGLIIVLAVLAFSARTISNRQNYQADYLAAPLADTNHQTIKDKPRHRYIWRMIKH